MIKRGGSWQSISHAQVLETVRAVSASLEALGVGRGDRIGLLSENRPEWAQTDYAALCVGALTVPLYSTLPANQLVYILKDSGASVLFVSNADQVAKIESILGELPELRTVVVFDDVPVLPQRTTRWRDLVDAGRRTMPPETQFRANALLARPGDLATLIYTSGTTGHPEGVMLTHNNLHSTVKAQEWLADAGGNDVALSFLPLSHVF